MRALSFFLLVTSISLTPAFAEVHTMTLRQALDRALEQNPDVLLSRLDEQKARDQVTIVRDPFSFKAGVGSGAAYTYGVPQSINGNAPAFFRAQGTMDLLNRPLSYRSAQASEAVRSAGLDITARQQDIAYRVYTTFLDADLAARSAEAVRQQAMNLQSVKSYHEARYAEGRERNTPTLQANVDIKKAEQSVREYLAKQTNSEIVLAQLLGFPAGDQVHPAPDERGMILLPESEEAAISRGIQDSLEIRRLESNIQGKMLEVKSYKAEHLPKVGLVSDYSLLSKFNNFETIYKTFQRNNFQLGVSIELPVLIGRAPKAAASQALTDIEKMRIEINRTRGRITADVKQAYSDLEVTEGARALAKEDLDLARAQTSDDLAQFQEGRIPMAQVDASKANEQMKWVAFYASQRDLETARLNILRNNGSLLAAVR